MKRILIHRVTTQRHCKINSVKLPANDKSAGAGKIISEMIKKPEKSFFMLDFFNLFFETGTCPGEWSKSMRAPVHKKVSPTNPPVIQAPH